MTQTKKQKRNLDKIARELIGEDQSPISKDDRMSDELWTERMKSGDIQKWDKDHESAFLFVDSLRKSSIESVKRYERWKKIYAIERTKWPHDMGSKLRDEIPEKLHPKLDECITKSQKIAAEACQTVELTETYLKKNSRNDKKST